MYLARINKILAETLNEKEYRSAIEVEMAKDFSPNEVKLGMERGDDWIKKIGGFSTFIKENSLDEAIKFFYACCNNKHKLAARLLSPR